MAALKAVYPPAFCRIPSHGVGVDSDEPILPLDFVGAYLTLSSIFHTGV